jgi:hypothetical protein
MRSLKVKVLINAPKPLHKLDCLKPGCALMKSIKTLTLSLLMLFFASAPGFSFAQGESIRFTVSGEQINFRPPSGWKLAWIEGSGDGPYLAEYIPELESIDTWREGYLAIQRYAYPPSDILKVLQANKVRVADMGLAQYINSMNKTCGKNHTPMSQKTNIFNGIYFVVGGGYCSKFDAIAPLGEGAFVAIAEGKQFFFRIQYGWRPKSVAEQNENLPWRITPDKAKEVS